jgi:hypothetical protein
MDDTCFIDSSQQRIQDTINLANEFYELHDIHINGRKSELIAINTSLAPHELYVTIRQENVVVKATNDEIRYLGVWFSAKRSRKKTHNKIKWDS